MLCKSWNRIINNYKLIKYQKLRAYSATSNTVSGCTGDIKLSITEQWSRNIHMFGESQTVAFDVSKAFNRVSLKEIASKLNSFRKNPTLIDWIDNFSLINPSCCRWIFLNQSQINTGQSSYLSVKLFLVFNNDLLSITRIRNPLTSINFVIKVISNCIQSF